MANKGFEKWAATKGCNLDSEPDRYFRPIYQDPVTAIAHEAYETGYAHATAFWRPDYDAAKIVINQHGLEKELQEALKAVRAAREGRFREYLQEASRNSPQP